MAIGKRIKFFRNRKGITLRKLGEEIGLKKESADVRIAQYETERRLPRESILCKIAEVLEVSPDALRVPNIDSVIGVMHTLFVLEDEYGFSIKESDIGPIIGLESEKVPEEMEHMLREWFEKRELLDRGEISQDEYNEWRYKLKH